MTTFDKREKAFEDKYFHDEEMKFKIISMRRKLLGIWAAKKIHSGEDESLKYACSIVEFGVKNNEDGAVVHKILADMQKAGIDITEKIIRDKMDHFHGIAKQKIAEHIMNFEQALKND